MGALIPEVAIAVVPLPMPVVVKAIPRERLHGRWSGPQIVGDAWRYWFRLCAADGVSPFEAEAACHVDVADDSFLQPLLRLVQPELGAGAVLHDPVVLACRRDDLLRLEHVVRDRLLDQHILPRLDGPDRL